MLNQIKKLFTKNSPEYRIVKNIAHDEILLEIRVNYWIEKKNNVNWYTVGPVFTDYDSCLKWYSKYQEYLKNKEVQYTYMNKKIV